MAGIAGIEQPTTRKLDGYYIEFRVVVKASCSRVDVKAVDLYAVNRL
jgi:hypothetical protein